MTNLVDINVFAFLIQSTHKMFQSCQNVVPDLIMMRPEALNNWKKLLVALQCLQGRYLALVYKRTCAITASKIMKTWQCCHQFSTYRSCDTKQTLLIPSASVKE